MNIKTIATAHKKIEEIQALMKRYTEHFTLQWSDDVSDWEDELEMRLIGGGAFLPAPYHTPPDLFLSKDDAGVGEGKGPWIFISYADEKMPRDMCMDIVEPSALEAAIANNNPLHNPEKTVWGDKNK